MLSDDFKTTCKKDYSIRFGSDNTEGKVRKRESLDI